MPPRVSLTIAIGDPSPHAAASAAHARAAAFLVAAGGRLGLDPTADVASLGGEEGDLLASAYAADPAWASRGPLALTPPPPLIAGTLVIEVAADAAPRAAANFVALCDGSAGTSKDGARLHYAGVAFHRIVSGFVAQGGDVAFGRGDPLDARKVGSGSASIYGGKFKDEPGGLKLRHGRGVVGMANSGKHGNGCQFYVCLGDGPSVRACDGKHVVVGRVMEDEGGVLDRIEAEAASADGTPRVRVAVVESGVV
jgi:cyclophilin family peptidyl-prolyl cis-trans isomerase